MGYRIFIVIMVIINSYCYGQLQSINNPPILDSLINSIPFGVSKIIVKKNNRYYLDTLLVDKLKISKKDSSIEIRYTNNTTATLRSSEAWGYITDFRECRRFYKGKMYTVWRTSAPFIYKLKSESASPELFFSTEITGPVLPLTPENASRVNDAGKKVFLNLYLQEYDQKNKTHPEENFGSALTATGEVLVGFLEITVQVFGVLLSFCND